MPVRSAIKPALRVGKKAPAFKLESSTGKPISLKDLAGSWVVLYFYPKDNTPGCTLEANDFQANLVKLKRLGVSVLGVSKDSLTSHCSFRDKYGLKFPLLSDPDGAMLEAYGAWGEKVLYGKKRLGIIRTTVLIAPDGKVKKLWPNVRVKGHVDDVIESVRALQKEG